MYTRHKSLVKKLIVIVSFGALLLTPISASALNNGQSVQDACSGVSQLDPSTGCNAGSSNNLESVAKTIVNILAKAVGIISVIMIIVAGFRYVLASGDSNNINNAKNTLIYAIVGLAIAVLAQFIATEVLTTSNNIQNGANQPGNSSVLNNELEKQLLE